MRKDLLGLLDGEEMEMYVNDLVCMLDASNQVINTQNDLIEAQRKMFEAKTYAQNCQVILDSFINTKRVKYNDQLYPKDKEVMDLNEEE